MRSPDIKSMTQDSAQSLFFVALLPPQDIQTRINQVKQHFADNYGSRAAQKSPPHITLQPPFRWLDVHVSQLQEHLECFASAYEPFPVALNGYGAFPPRVIYIHVSKTPELSQLQADLAVYLHNLGIRERNGQKRLFKPHLTVAFRDLSKQNFQAAWPQIAQRSLAFDFFASSLSLLRHNGYIWQAIADFKFSLAGNNS